MPKLERPIPETDTLVVRSVALGVIQEVLINRMGLPSTIPVNFPGYAEGVAQVRSLISNPNEDARFPTGDKIFIEVSEEYVTDWLPAAQTKSPEQIPCFLNKDLELELRPIYASMEMRISIHYRAKGKTDARRFYDFMMTKLPNREDTWIHTLNYAYGIPDVYMAILEEIHRLTELRAGYGDKFEDFFNKWVHPRYGMLTDQAGKNEYGVFSETQTQCIGYFDMNAVPDFGGKKDDTEVWEIEIPYVIRYDKPKDMYMSYPIVIHNSVLSQTYRGSGGMPRMEDYSQVRPKTIHSMRAAGNAFALGRNFKDFPGRYFPLYDEWLPRTIPENTMRVFQALVIVGEETDADPRLLMNVTDLEADQYGFVLNACVKDYMRKNAQYLTQDKEAGVNIALYSGRTLLDSSWLEVDEDLNIRSTRPLDPRRYYHVRMSLTTDLGFMSKEAKERLRRFPCMISNILEYVKPERTVLPLLQLANGVVKPGNYDDIAEWMKNRPAFVSMKTVQTTKMSAVYTSKR